jgi:hypothetical protein
LTSKSIISTLGPGNISDFDVTVMKRHGHQRDEERMSRACKFPLFDADIHLYETLVGSDYPHPEGLAEPRSYLDHLPESFSEEDVEKIMGGNLARIMRVGVTV